MSSAALVSALRMISTVTGSRVLTAVIVIFGTSVSFDVFRADDQGAELVDLDVEHGRHHGGGGLLHDDGGSFECVAGAEVVTADHGGVGFDVVKDHPADFVLELRALCGYVTRSFQPSQVAD